MSNKKPSMFSDMSDTEWQLRRILGMSVGAPGLYGDDGELCDGTAVNSIDYMRDSVADIEKKLSDRGLTRLVKEVEAVKLLEQSVPLIERILQTGLKTEFHNQATLLLADINAYMATIPDFVKHVKLDEPKKVKPEVTLSPTAYWPFPTNTKDTIP